MLSEYINLKTECFYMKGNFFYKRLGKKVLEARLNKKFTQKKLSQHSKIDRSYIIKLENGKVNPSIAILAKLAFALEINLILLFAGV